MIELRLLAHPEKSQRQKAHEVDEDFRRDGEERLAEFVLVVNQFARWDVEFDGEKGHGHAEDAVAESRKALDALAGDAIVGSDHFVSEEEIR